MKITVITGSPRKKGTSALLADEFIRGAKQSGHEVFRFESAFADVRFCTACNACGIGVGSAPCVQEDDMRLLNPHMLEADVVALVTPLYYYGFSAQIKRVIDRFCANSYRFTGNKKVILLATSYDDNDWTMQALIAHYETLARYMQWEDAGRVLATGCGERADIERTAYPKAAYELGRNL